MERNKLGEYILDHYEKYLGQARWRRIAKDAENKPAIQLLQYDNVFENCIVYASEWRVD